MAIDVQDQLRRPRPGPNSYRWDEIGPYIVSTIHLPALLRDVTGAAYETLISAVADRWDAIGDGVHTDTQARADDAHDAACERARARIQ